MGDVNDKRSRLRRLLRPVARKLLHNTVAPTSRTRWLYAGMSAAEWYGRELYEWGWRSLIATPVFLSQCAVHGEGIAVDRVPYITGTLRIELGNDVRFSGKVDINGANRGDPVLKIGTGVYVGHRVRLAVARRVEIGDFVAIGSHTYITDTEGHSAYNPQRPIWEVFASDDDIADVVIEDNVQIGQGCMILKGVRIGARSLIGAGAVVRTNIPPDSIVMGNPARVVKRLGAADARKPAVDVGKAAVDGGKTAAGK